MPEDQKYYWIVGRYLGEKPWTFYGLFSTPERALRQCKHKHDFIAKVELDAFVPEELREFDESWFPYDTDETDEEGFVLILKD